MGFEPMKELLLYTLSKRAPSTTRPPLLHNFSVFFLNKFKIKIKLHNIIILNYKKIYLNNLKKYIFKFINKN